MLFEIEKAKGAYLMSFVKFILIYVLAFGPTYSRAETPQMQTHEPERTSGLNRLSLLSPEGQRLEAMMSAEISKLSQQISASGEIQEGDVPLTQIETEGVSLNDLVNGSESAVAEVLEMTPEEVNQISVKKKTGLIAKILAFGHVNTLHKLINTTMQKLKVNGDNPNYTVKITGSPMPNAAIYKGEAFMLVNAGLIGWTKNVDEFAGVIAHEMTHDNMKMMEAKTDQDSIDELLNQVKGYSDLEPEQREEIRADLGATERLILAGYNPWSYYNFEKRFTAYMHKSIDSRIIKSIFRVFFRQSFDYWEAHPAGEIRMAAVKAYIIYRSRQVDISQQVETYESLGLGMKLLKLRMLMFSEPLMNIWVQRAIYGYFGFNITNAIYTSITSTALTDTALSQKISETYQGSVVQDTASEAIDIIGAGSSKVGEILSYAISPVKYAIKYIAQVAPDNLFSYIVMCGIVAAIVKFIAGLYKHTYLADNSFKTYREAKKNWFSSLVKEIESLHESEVDPVIQQQSILKRRIKAASAMDSIFRNSNGTLTWFTATNGLMAMEWSVNSLIQLSLQKFIKSFKSGKISPEKFQEVINDTIGSIPLYTWQSNSVTESLLEAAELANIELVTIIDTPEPPQAQTLTGGLQILGMIKRFKEVRLPTLRLTNNNTHFEEAVEMAARFAKIGLFAYIPQLLGRYPRSTMQKIFSKTQGSPKLANELRAAITAMKFEGQRSENGFFYCYFYDLLFATDKLFRIFQPISNQLVNTELTRNLKISGWSWISLRYWLEKGDYYKLKHFFKLHFSSIKSLAEFIDQEIIIRNFSAATFVRQLFDSMKKNPSVIKNMEDVDLLLDREYFWPTVSGSLNNPGYLENIFIQIVRENVLKYPEVWNFEPSASEVLHGHIYNYLKSINSTRLTDRDQLEDLWYKMTNRGVTSITDKLFHDLYSRSSLDQKHKLEESALKNGRVWESEIKQRIAIDMLNRYENFQKLKFNTDITDEERKDKIYFTLSHISSIYPDRGNGYAEILEYFSVQINSTESESRIIHNHKTRNAGGNRQEDLGLRALSDLLNRALMWPKSQQWELILFLRGDMPPNKKVQNAFKVLGPERIKRMYDVLPDIARAQLIDSFIDSPAGLVGRKSLFKNWQATIISQLLKDANPEEASIAKDVLDAFMYALKKTGNGPMRSYILSYLLALPKTQNGSAGQTLKNILEIFGTTGIKIGQFLAASEILPDKDTALLRSLNERANPPLREQIYSDLRAGLRSESVHLQIRHLLGAASMKYAVLIEEPESGDRVVLKVFRGEALHHTNIEFKLLEQMSEYLVKTNGAKYTIFKSIVNASRAAVEKELSVSGEVVKSNLARTSIYTDVQGNVEVSVPRDTYLSDSIIAAEFAEGVSFYEIKPEHQALVAETIIKQETQNLFKNSPVIVFDPDRHAGNYRVHIVEKPNGEFTTKLSPIDFGQLVQISSTERSEVIELFALSQILAYSGANEWAKNLLVNKYSTELDSKKLLQNLNMLFPAKDGKPITAYYLLLSALEGAGYKVKVTYFDFLRAIIQIKQYEKFLPAERDYKTASEILEEQVKSRVEELRSMLQMSRIESLRFLRSDYTERRKNQSVFSALGGVIREHILGRPRFDTAQTEIDSLTIVPEKQNQILAPASSGVQNSCVLFLNPK